MNVVSLSSCYPSPDTPHAGLFVYRRLAALNDLEHVRVIHPVPTAPWSCFTEEHARHWWPSIFQSRDRERAVNSDAVGPDIAQNDSDIPTPPPVWHVPMPYVPGFSRPLNARLYARALRPVLETWVRRGWVDLIDAHFSWPDGVAAGALARRFGRPFTITLRGVLGRYLRDPLLRGSIVASLRQADGVIAVSRHLADLAVRAGADAAKVCVIPNGVDVDTFKPGDRDDARRALGRSPRETILITVGHLCQRKGVHRVLRILPELLRWNDRLRYVVVGSDGGEGRFERTVKSLTDRLGLRPFVTFTGALAPEKVAQWLQAADLFVLPTSNEGCCNAIREALAAGLPVATTDVGGNGETVTSACGALVPFGDGVALRSAVVDTLNRQFDRAAIAKAHRHVTWSDVARETSAFLRSVARTRRRPITAATAPYGDCPTSAPRERPISTR